MQGAAQVAPTASPRPRAAQERSRAHTKGRPFSVIPSATRSTARATCGSRKPYPGSPYTAGGVNLPWGITVDGDDTVWVFNFGTVPPSTGMSTELPTGIS
jgi:hypothetical protein